MKYLIIIATILLGTSGAYAQVSQDRTEIVLSERDKPKYPGGDAELRKYLSLNLRYPTRALEEGIEGEVLIGFVIDVEGTVTDIKILKGIGHGCDEEAIRVVRGMPQWKPAQIKGKVVKVAYRLPVVFELPSSAERTKRL
jgi:periplasmic protein TonB